MSDETFHLKEEMYMSVFDAEKKPGYGLGLSIIVTDENGNQISAEHLEAMGFDNAMVDIARVQVKDALEALVVEWRKAKAAAGKSK